MPHSLDCCRTWLAPLVALYLIGITSPLFAQRKLDFDPDWTPRPQEGDVPAYVKETDIDWIDPRLQEMNTGRTWNATFRYPDAYAKTAEGGPLMHRSFKGTAIRIGEEGDAAVLFDRNQLRVACVWTGDFLTHSDRRFGLLNTPQPTGEVLFSTHAEAAWMQDDAPSPQAVAATGPLPRDVGHFNGMFRHGDRTVLSYSIGESGQVLESPWVVEHEGHRIFSRTLLIRGLTEPHDVVLGTTSPEAILHEEPEGKWFADVETPHGAIVWTCRSLREGCVLRSTKGETGRLLLSLPAIDNPTVVQVQWELVPSPKAGERPGYPAILQAANAQSATSLPKSEDFEKWTSPGRRQWNEEIITQGDVANDDAPYVIDTFGVPFENPYKALMFLSGVDFIGDDVYVSTAHGDVWRLTGVDDTLDEVVWQRYATGLYQPLGLKVVDSKVMVLERGQLTRLHDLNEDGEADFYESFNADWHVGGGEHSYDTCLETDPEGNFYFHSTGDPQVPTGGTVIKVSPDGQTSEVFCTGFRHPIGMGVLPDGRITGADQEGNWMPSTRIDIYRKGGFYGDFRAHHRDPPPETYDGPLCWLPRQLDGSAGGEVTVPENHWGHLAGRTLHMSFGRCRLMLLMMQQIGDIDQAGAVDLGLQFDAGIQRGRFRPSDGNLYLVGMDGWQTAAIADGCLQRVRYTGKRWMSPIDLKIERDGIRLTFSEPLDREIAVQTERYHIEQWNYLWSGEYGSSRYSVASPGEEGQDEVPVTDASVSADGLEVFLSVPNLAPVMQMQIEYRLVDEQGEEVKGAVYNTIHTTGT
ncbi:MAG: hypothetical protein KDA93_08965 [Planctomycetaceae bacterium]|nr:hypothetical protein [Planctomycetaceae bacterium]